MTRPTQSPAGFTMVEMLFTLAIGSFILAGVVTSYIFTVRGFRGLSNYNEIQADGRRGLERLARDLQAGLNVVSCTTNRLVIFLPATVDATGQVTASNQVTHLWQDGQWYRHDAAGGSSTMLAANIAQMSFSLYNAVGNVTTQVNSATSVEVEAWFQKTVANNKQTTDFLSARLRLRNAS